MTCEPVTVREQDTGVVLLDLMTDALSRGDLYQASLFAVCSIAERMYLNSISEAK